MNVPTYFANECSWVSCVFFEQQRNNLHQDCLATLSTTHYPIMYYWRKIIKWWENITFLTKSTTKYITIAFLADILWPNLFWLHVVKMGKYTMYHPRKNFAWGDALRTECSKVLTNDREPNIFQGYRMVKSELWQACELLVLKSEHKLFLKKVRI